VYRQSVRIIAWAMRWSSVCKHGQGGPSASTVSSFCISCAIACKGLSIHSLVTARIMVVFTQPHIDNKLQRLCQHKPIRHTQHRASLTPGRASGGPSAPSSSALAVFLVFVRNSCGSVCLKALEFSAALHQVHPFTRKALTVDFDP
jgi:hypothetical protein